MATAHTNTHCPLTKQPLAECAVRAITGASIPKINRYCMGDYALCPVYKTQHNRDVHGEDLHSTVAENTQRERRRV